MRIAMWKPVIRAYPASAWPTRKLWRERERERDFQTLSSTVLLLWLLFLFLQNRLQGSNVLGRVALPQFIGHYMQASFSLNKQDLNTCWQHDASNVIDGIPTLVQSRARRRTQGARTHITTRHGIKTRSHDFYKWCFQRILFRDTTVPSEYKELTPKASMSFCRCDSTSDFKKNLSAHLLMPSSIQGVHGILGRLVVVFHNFEQIPQQTLFGSTRFILGFFIDFLC